MTGAVHRRRATAVLFLLVVGLSCSKTSKPYVDRLSIDEFEGRTILGLSVEQLEARLRRTLESKRFVMMTSGDVLPEGVKPWRLTLAVNIIEPDPEEGPIGRVEAALSLNQRGGDESFEVHAHDMKTASSNQVEDIQEATRVALESVLVQLVAESRALIELRDATASVLIEKLSNAQRPVRDAAVTLLARQHHSAALNPLLARLESNDLGEIRRTMGLLIELKDPQAVPALIDVSRARDNLVQREVVFALGAIGGDEAEAYLWSLSQGHDDALIRASAEQALQELKARKQVTQ